jgi:hypothetical protein
MGSMNGHSRKSPTFVFAGGDNECPASSVSSELREILNLNVVNGQRGEQGHAPRAGLGTPCGIALLDSLLGEFGVGVKVEAPVTAKEAMDGMPPATTHLISNPNAGGELDKLSL